MAHNEMSTSVKEKFKYFNSKFIFIVVISKIKIIKMVPKTGILRNIIIQLLI